MKIYSITPKSFVILATIFKNNSHAKPQRPPRKIWRHYFASFAALRDNKICLQSCTALGIIIAKS
jgi:hypothetical protein